MADLTIVHDPDSGCVGCVLCGVILGCDPDGRPESVVQCAAGGSYGVPWGDDLPTAPDWCPLRTARVVVQRPLRARMLKMLDRLPMSPRDVECFFGAESRAELQRLIAEGLVEVDDALLCVVVQRSNLAPSDS